jgi:hypothetical protein
MTVFIWPMIGISDSDKLHAVKHERKFKVVVCGINAGTKLNDFILNKTVILQFKTEFGFN